MVATISIDAAGSKPMPPCVAWPTLQSEALLVSEREPILRPTYRRTVLDPENFSHALSEVICDALSAVSVDIRGLRSVIVETLVASPEIAKAAAIDLCGSYERNPAYTSLLTAFLHAKGFTALATHRICHELWLAGRHDLALHLHSLSCRAFSVDIHPAAVVGVGVFIDHATGLVVGETARIGDNVSILHGVTLGGTGNEVGARHPKIGSGVLLGAYSVVLGNITIGDGVKVGAGSVVLKSVPSFVTIAGIPARIVKISTANSAPAITMDHQFM